MYYIKEKDYVLEKYLIEFNKEELLKLLKEVKDNCSLITSYEFDGEMPNPEIFDYSKTRNFNSEFIETDENSELYHISYEYIEKTPLLLHVIEGLLEEKPEYLDYILGDKKDKFNKDNLYNTTLVNLCSDIENTNKNNQKKEYLNELIRLIKFKDINKNQKSEVEYLPILISLITSQLIASIRKDELDKVNLFLNGTNKKSLTFKIKEK